MSSHPHSRQRSFKNWMGWTLARLMFLPVLIHLQARWLPFSGKKTKFVVLQTLMYDMLLAGNLNLQLPGLQIYHFFISLRWFSNIMYSETLSLSWLIHHPICISPSSFILSIFVLERCRCDAGIKVNYLSHLSPSRFSFGSSMCVLNASSEFLPKFGREPTSQDNNMADPVLALRSLLSLTYRHIKKEEVPV